MIELIGSLYQVKMRAEGDVRIQFDVSAQYLTQAMALAAYKEEALALRIAKMAHHEDDWQVVGRWIGGD